MMTIVTSTLLSTTDIDERLKNELFIKSICDDVFHSQNGIVYLIRYGYYKLEFCFSKEHAFIYFMVEMFESKQQLNKYLSFIDDLNLFNDINAINKFVSGKVNDDRVRIQNIEIYIDKRKIDSIYLLSSRTNQ
ncbi:MAG: hypothetical protein J1E57_08640 [Prevotella sp.]|nr:hypothetical protein [Prevotella sp.]